LPKPSHSTVPSNDASVPHPPQSIKCYKSKNKEHMHRSGSLEAFQTAAVPLKDSWTFGTFVLLCFLHSTQKRQTWMFIFSYKIICANNTYKYI